MKGIKVKSCSPAKDKNGKQDTLYIESVLWQQSANLYSSWLHTATTYSTSGTLLPVSNTLLSVTSCCSPVSWFIYFVNKTSLPLKSACAFTVRHVSLLGLQFNMIWWSDETSDHLWSQHEITLECCRKCYLSQISAWQNQMTFVSILVSIDIKHEHFWDRVITFGLAKKKNWNQEIYRLFWN